MVTDEERREVARKFRELADICEDEDFFDTEDFGGRVANLFPDADTEREAYQRLADLIEPPTQCPHYHSGRHYCSIHEDMQPIDRDTLLYLADLMDCTYKAPDAAHYYAKSIRRALGVTDETDEPDENICDDCDMHCDLNGAVNCPFGGE